MFISFSQSKAESVGVDDSQELLPPGHSFTEVGKDLRVQNEGFYYIK